MLHYKDENLELHLVGWRGNKTLRAYIDVNDSVHMLRLLDADISKYGKGASCYDPKSFTNSKYSIFRFEQVRGKVEAK